MQEFAAFAAAYCAGGSPDPEQFHVYAQSVRRVGDGMVCLADASETDVLVAYPHAFGLSGMCAADGCVIAPLSHENADALRVLFPDTAPVRVLDRDATFGLGDRLGIAGEGHLRVFSGCGATPVLAQQSMRELNLTKRTYADVIDAATFAAFRAGYLRGFGADGDHLKTEAEIRGALGAGCTMITLDCSEHIRTGKTSQGEGAQIDREAWNALRLRYPETLRVGGSELFFSDDTLAYAAFVYGRAIEFAASIYGEFFAGAGCGADLELSIDETSTPTTPEQHYFVANELYAHDVRLATLAPRFTGEFQKGVDYRGDIAQFEKELIAHCEIAREFGYKLSIHSGSDKFSVFPAIGQYTRGRFHLKTAGTSWLEAMRVVAQKDPTLYREAHALALSSFDKARAYYHVTTNLKNVPPLFELADAALPALFENEDARQLIHITYGFLLANESLKSRLYALWRRERGAYADALYRHIGRHVELVTGKEPAQS